MDELAFKEQRVFGFAKTSLDDIATRADLSRTSLYKLHKNKDDICRAVFLDWLISRHPAARQAARERHDPARRLMRICRLMAIEPWADMVDAPMGSEFLAACGRIDPETEALHRRVADFVRARQ